MVALLLLSVLVLYDNSNNGCNKQITEPHYILAILAIINAVISLITLLGLGFVTKMNDLTVTIPLFTALILAIFVLWYTSIIIKGYNNDTQITSEIENASWAALVLGIIALITNSTTLGKCGEINYKTRIKRKFKN